MNNLEARIERLTERVLPEKPFVYVLDLRSLARGGTDGLTPSEVTEGRRQARQAAKSGRPFVMVTLRDDSPALPPAAGEGKAISEETEEPRDYLPKTIERESI